MTQARMATGSDAPGIARVQVDAWRAAYRGLMDAALHDALDASRRAPVWEAFLARPDHQLFVVEHKEVIIGYAHLCAAREGSAASLTDAPSLAEIASIYVASHCWRQGVGTRLLDAVETAVRVLGHGGAVLWVLESNHAGRRFYERFGYTPDGGRKHHPGSGLVELRYFRSLV
jgi:GNAT superfamily N-acetyltransferase